LQFCQELQSRTTKSFDKSCRCWHLVEDIPRGMNDHNLGTLSIEGYSSCSQVSRIFCNGITFATYK
jgi:hypothetical protein